MILKLTSHEIITPESDRKRIVHRLEYDSERNLAGIKASIKIDYYGGGDFPSSGTFDELVVFFTENNHEHPNQ